VDTTEESCPAVRRISLSRFDTGGGGSCGEACGIRRSKLLLATNQMYASEARNRHQCSAGVTAIVAAGSRIPAVEIRPSHRALSGVTVSQLASCKREPRERGGAALNLGNLAQLPDEIHRRILKYNQFSERGFLTSSHLEDTSQHHCTDSPLEPCWVRFVQRKGLHLELSKARDNDIGILVC